MDQTHAWHLSADPSGARLLRADAELDVARRPQAVLGDRRALLGVPQRAGGPGQRFNRSL